MSTRKMTPLESELSALTDDLLEQIDEIGQKHGYSHEFYMGIHRELGGDFADIYSEWVEESQHHGVPQ